MTVVKMSKFWHLTIFSTDILTFLPLAFLSDIFSTAIFTSWHFFFSHFFYWNVYLWHFPTEIFTPHPNGGLICFLSRDEPKCFGTYFFQIRNFIRGNVMWNKHPYYDVLIRKHDILHTINAWFTKHKAWTSSRYMDQSLWSERLKVVEASNLYLPLLVSNEERPLLFARKAVERLYHAIRVSSLRMLLEVLVDAVS